MENKKSILKSVSNKLLFRNFTHFAKVKTPEISQNVLIAKVSMGQKMSKLYKINKKENKLLRINKFRLPFVPFVPFISFDNS